MELYMNEQSHWRKNRPISFSSEDNARLERLKEQASHVRTDISYGLVVRAALQVLAKLPDWKFRAAIEAVPRTQYGPEPHIPKPKLSEEEAKALMQKLEMI